MAKRTVDFSDYKEQEWDEYTGDDPRPGMWLNGKVVRARYDEEDDQVVFFVSVVDHADYAGWTRGYYGPFEGNVKWKLQEMLKALQGKAAPVTLDWENETAVANWLKKQKTIRFQTEEYNDKIRIRKVRPLLEAVGTGKAAPAPAPSAEPDDAEDDTVEDYTQDELEAMPAEELAEILVEEFEYAEADVPKKGRRQSADAYKEQLVNMILDEQDPDDEPDTAEDGADEGGAAEFEDGFEDAADESAEEPEPEPAPRARRGRAAKATPAPAKAAPAKAAAATTTRRRRG